MNNPIKKKINTFGKVGKVVIIVLIALMIACEACLAFSTVMVAIAPEDMFSFRVSQKIQVKLNSELFGEDADEAYDVLSNQTVYDPLIRKSEYDDISFQKNEDSFEFDATSSTYTYTIKDSILTLLLCIVDIAAYIVGLFFAKSLMKEFQRCDTPFCDNVVKRMRNLAIAMIPIVLISSVTSSALSSFFTPGGFNFTINITAVVAIVIIFMLVLIFKYGARLQQESDETF